MGVMLEKATFNQISPYCIRVDALMLYIITNLFYYCMYSKCFAFVWCPCMAINVVSLQHNNGGFLPGIILLTQCYYHRGRTRLNAMKRFSICSLSSHLLSVLTFFPLTEGCSEGLDAFRFFF